MTPRVPRRGDLVWLTFDPTLGHEQAGRRPAVVLSVEEYNRASGLLLASPVTSRAKGYTFEVPVRVGSIGGVALADQTRSVAWRERRCEIVGQVDPTTVAIITRRLGRLIGG